MQIEKFLNSFELLSHSNLYLDHNEATGEFSTPKQKPRSVHTEQIISYAQTCFHELLAKRDEMGKTNFKSQMERFKSSLDGYNDRVLNSVRNSWWYWIAECFGYRFEVPQSLSLLTYNVFLFDQGEAQALPHRGAVVQDRNGLNPLENLPKINNSDSRKPIEYSPYASASPSRYLV